MTTFQKPSISHTLRMIFHSNENETKAEKSTDFLGFIISVRKLSQWQELQNLLYSISYTI